MCVREEERFKKAENELDSLMENLIHTETQLSYFGVKVKNVGLSCGKP